LATHGISSLDLTNAFNSVSRHHLASVIGVQAPFLLGFFRWGYGVASSLFVRGPNGIHVIQSREGGRQGDPMFPFLFSLAIRPLVEELAERFALKVTIADKDGDLVEKRLIWAYLDDITIALRPGVSHQDVLDFFSDPDIVDKYGLLINPTKSWHCSQDDLTRLGHKLLGSWIGGPDNDSSGATMLLQKAVDMLDFIIPILKRMPLQNGFLLLRLCYYPILNFLLRTLPLNVGHQQIQQFDTLIWQVVKDWVRDSSISPHSEDIAHLPIRLGGFGFFDSAATRPYAAAASYIQSSGFLRSRNLVLSGSVELKLKTCLKNFADDLNMEYDELFDDVFWKEKDLQRRGCELSREIKWAQLFQSLDDFDKIRFIENQSSLRRKWMESLPIHKGLTLSDSQVRYGIQECLLSKFPEAVSPTRTCLEYRNLEDGPLHHFTCKATDALRTARHHAIHHLFEQKMKECNARSIERYPFVGLGADGRTRIGDTAAIIRDVRSNFDYMIVAADYTRKVRIPPLQESMAEVEV